MIARPAWFFGLMIATASASHAVEPGRAADDPPMLSLVVENDSFGGTDRNYSNGLYASLLSAPGDVPDWFARLARQLPNIEDDHTLRRGLGVGHTLFTPRDITAPNWRAGQHPYAGWLYGSLLGVSEDRNTVRTAQINIGIVGPAALGEAVQNNFHSLIGVDEAQGWDDQLQNELAFEIILSRQYRALQGRLPIGLDVDLVPELNLALGTVSTQAGAGVMVRIGDRLQNDFGPPRVRAGTAGASYFAVGGEGIDWYVFAGVEGRAVARNIFLDGNTFRDSPSVDREAWVAEVQAGFVLKYGRYQLGFTAVYRTEEFDTQLDPQRFGAISLARRF
ncbi:MAG: lipid A deacylase LpxR family protein [Pseudomonadota bacterium]